MSDTTKPPAPERPSSNRQPAPRPEATPLDTALAALAKYDAGSSRAALLPIDEAVRAGAGDAAASHRLEAALLTVLRHPASVVARAFACRNLGLIGSRAAVPALAAFLDDPLLSDAARDALEALPGAEPVTTLRDHLPTATGPRRVGIINSLGRRRDARSVSALARLANDSDPAIAGAAVAALGEIGTGKAAGALQKLPPQTRTRVALAFADACLRCAEHLANAGQTREAARLREELSAGNPPKHVRLALERANSERGVAR